MYCGHCGEPIQTTDLYCGHCGEKIEQAASQQSTAPVAENVHAAAPMPPVQAGTACDQKTISVCPEAPAAVVESSPVLQTWKTADNFAIFGFALGFFLVDPGPRLVSRLGYSPYDVAWAAWAYVMYYFFVVVYYTLPLLYAAIVYPSYFGNKPLLKSNKLISFFNLFCGSFFGLFWNHNLTRKTKGIAHLVALVFCSFRIVLLLVTTVFASLYTAGVVEPGEAEPSSSAVWRSYIYHDQGFTVDFPGTPRIERVELEPDDICTASTEYTLIKGSAVYSVVVTEYPEGYFDGETETRAVLDGYIDSLVQNGDYIVDERNSTDKFSR